MVVDSKQLNAKEEKYKRIDKKEFKRKLIKRAKRVLTVWRLCVCLLSLYIRYMSRDNVSMNQPTFVNLSMRIHTFEAYYTCLLYTSRCV